MEKMRGFPDAKDDISTDELLELLDRQLSTLLLLRKLGIVAEAQRAGGAFVFLCGVLAARFDEEQDRKEKV